MLFSYCMLVLFIFFFFQAEDGIRDHCVTGVQTCALPIYGARLELARRRDAGRGARQGRRGRGRHGVRQRGAGMHLDPESEERRVGKECRSRWWAWYVKKKKKRRRQIERV